MLEKLKSLTSSKKISSIFGLDEVLIQELSLENMALGRDRQAMANTIADQHRRIEIYKRQLV